MKFSDDIVDDNAKSPRKGKLLKLIQTNICRICIMVICFLCLACYGAIEWFFIIPPEDNIALFEARNFPSFFSDEDRDAYLKAEELKRRYTVRVNTFRRNDLLKQVVEHYVTCPNIDRIQVIWSDLQNKPPPASYYDIKGLYIESNLEEVNKEEKAHHYHGPTLQYEIHSVDSLNNRFMPILPIITEAVLSVDDDLYLPCDLLDFTHSVWRQSPRTMVGFMPRMHGHEAGHFTYLNWWHVWRHGVYSMILSKACFLHQDFLHYYAGTREPNYQLLSSSMPPPLTHEITLAPGSNKHNRKHLDQTASSTPSSSSEALSQVRAYVDEHMNCEDIAMSFLVANLTQLPAVWVRGQGITEIGHQLFQGDQGISSDQVNHYAARSSCVDRFVSLFGKMPLTTATSKVDRSSNSWLWR